MSQIIPIPITPLPKPSLSNGLPTPNSLHRFPSVAEIGTSDSSSNFNSNLIATSSNLEQSNSAVNFRRSMSEDSINNGEINVYNESDIDYSMEFGSGRNDSGEQLNYSGGELSDNSLDMSSLQVPDTIESSRELSSHPATMFTNERPFRSRYAPASPILQDRITTPSLQDLPRRIPTPTSFKRTHSQAASISRPETLASSRSSSGDPFSVFRSNTSSTLRPILTPSVADGFGEGSNWRNSLSSSRFDSQRVSLSGRSSIFRGSEESLTESRDDTVRQASSSEVGAPGRFKRARSFSIDPLLSSIRNLTSSSSSSTNNVASIPSPNDSVPSSPTRRRRISLNSLNFFPQSNVVNSSSSPSSSSQRLGSRRLRSISPVSSAHISRVVSGLPSDITARRATATSYRVSPGVEFAARAPPVVTLDRESHPYHSIWREEIHQSRDHSQPMNTFDNTREVDQVLGDASDRLLAAETTLREAIRVIQEDGVEVVNNNRSRTESLRRTVDFLDRSRSISRDNMDSSEQLSRIPSTRNLPIPERSNELAPIIGFRLGSSPIRSSLATSTARNPRVPSPSIPIPPLQSSASSSSTGPRFRSNRPVEWDEATELVQAEVLRRRMNEARAAAGVVSSSSLDRNIRTTSGDSNEGRLWGEVTDSTNRNDGPGPLPTPRTTSHLTYNRMRGPTERANELRRRRFDGFADNVQEPIINEVNLPGFALLPSTPATSSYALRSQEEMMAFSGPPRGVVPGSSSRSNSPSPIRNLPQVETTGIRAPRSLSVREAFDLEIATEPFSRRTSLFNRIQVGQSSRRIPAVQDRRNSTETRSSVSAEARRVSHALFDEESLITRQRPLSPTVTHEDNLPPLFTRRTSLVDALANISTRPEFRRRRAPVVDTAAAVATEVERPDTTNAHLFDAAVRTAQDLRDHRSRLDRLERMREERIERMGRESRNNGESDSALSNIYGERPAGVRRRSIGEMFRDFRGAGGARAERFGAFLEFGRDAVVLDPRNYLSDDNFDDSYESLLRLSARLGDVKPKDRGLSREKISSFNTFKYADWPSRSTDLRESIQAVASTSALPLSDGNSEKEEKCGICLTEYEVDDDILMSPCSHGFHSPCLSAWFNEHNSCPLCRKSFA